MTEVNFIIAFGAGILSFVSPCVLPLLPGYLSLMSGYSVAELESGSASSVRMLRVTGLFVLGFTVVFVALGAAATGVGSFLARNKTLATQAAGWVVVGFGLLIVWTAVSKSSLLARLTRERRVEVRPSRLGIWAPPLMGLAFGFAWTPCIGPVLGVILTAAAVQDTVVRGMVLLFVFALGLGVPFVLAGVGMSRAFRAMQVLRRYVRPLNIASGLLLAGFGVLMITGQINVLSSWISRLLIDTPLERLAEI